MKLFKKTLREYFYYLNWALIFVLLLSLLQSAILFFKVEVSTQMNVITLLGAVKIGILFLANFYFTVKKKFKLGNNFIAGILFFVFSMITFFFTLVPETVPTLFRLVLYPLIFTTNFIIYVLVALVAGFLGKLFLKYFKNDSSKKK